MIVIAINEYRLITFGMLVSIIIKSGAYIDVNDILTLCTNIEHSC